MLDCLTLRQSRHHKKKMFNDLIALEGDLLCQKNILFHYKKKSKWEFPVVTIDRKTPDVKINKMKYNKIRFFITSSTRQEAMVDTTLSLFSSFFFKIKRKDIKRQNIIPIRKKGPKTWFESERDRKLFFSFYLVTKITNVNNRKSQTKVQKNFFHKISTLKWMFMALNLSLSIIIFFK